MGRVDASLDCHGVNRKKPHICYYMSITSQGGGNIEMRYIDL